MLQAFLYKRKVETIKKIKSQRKTQAKKAKNTKKREKMEDKLMKEIESSKKMSMAQIVKNRMTINNIVKNAPKNQKWGETRKKKMK